MPGRRRQSKCRRPQCRHQIARYCDGLSPLEFVGEITRPHFGEAGHAVGNAFDQSQPRGRRAKGRQESGHDRGGRFVGPIAEQGSQTHAQDGSVEPARAGRVVMVGEFHRGRQARQLQCLLPSRRAFSTFRLRVGCRTMMRRSENGEMAGVLTPKSEEQAVRYPASMTSSRTVSLQLP